MFEAFSDAARRAVVLAQEEARMLNHNYLGTEHLLLGVLHLDDTRFPGIARDAVVAQLAPGEGQTAAHVPFTPAAKAALEVAFHTARRQGQPVQPAHLLLGALHVEGSPAPDLLTAAGGDPAVLRQALIAELGEPPTVRVREFAPSVETMRRTKDIRGLDVLDRLGDDVLAALAAAKREASRLGLHVVGPELVAFGLLVAPGVVRDALLAGGATEEAARAALGAAGQTGDSPHPAIGREVVDALLAEDSGPALLGALLRDSVGAALLLVAAGVAPDQVASITSNG